MNLREAWAKRRYEAHFISKLTDCDGENSETDTALDFAFECGYLSKSEQAELVDLCAEVGKMLGSIMNMPEIFVFCFLFSCFLIFPAFGFPISDS